ncbi:putative ribosomal protein S3 [Helianthus annuus]|nr:putative ribosomal protein S3 [Helianthus annuus]KAJ0631812.1 putative ribosomal protein S3 [Helianthus annuus]KAJ0825573.1 putative ribosomal protein S3 [Helianthus annuus]
MVVAMENWNGVVSSGINKWFYLVIVSGKLRAQRAKSMKFKDGYMVSSGQPVKEYIDSAVRHVLLRQGVLGIKVKIMLDWDPTGKLGPKTSLPDNVVIHMPKDDVVALPPKEVEEYRPPLVLGDEPFLAYARASLNLW